MTVCRVYFEKKYILPTGLKEKEKKSIPGCLWDDNKTELYKT